MTEYLQAFLGGVALGCYGMMFFELGKAVWNGDVRGAAAVSTMLVLVNHFKF